MEYVSHIGYWLNRNRSSHVKSADIHTWRATSPFQYNVSCFLVVKVSDLWGSKWSYWGWVCSLVSCVVILVGYPCSYPCKFGKLCVTPSFHITEVIDDLCVCYRYRGCEYVPVVSRSLPQTPSFIWRFIKERSLKLTFHG